MVDTRALWHSREDDQHHSKLLLTTFQVIHNSDLSTPFGVATDARQGRILPPMIFSLVIHWVMNDTDSGLQLTFIKNLNDLDLAADIALFSPTHTATCNTYTLCTTAHTTIDTQKNKILRVNTTEHEAILTKEQPIEEVETFTYHGRLVKKYGGGAEEDVKARIGKAINALKSP